MRIDNKIALRALFTIIVFIGLVSSVYAQIISSDTINSEGITAITEDIDSEFVFNEIKKIYEISDSSLEEGYSATLNEKDAFRIKVKERNYYIIVWNITDDDKIHILFPGERILAYEVGSMALIDINQDNKLDIQLELKAIEEDYEDTKVVASVELESETATIKDVEYIPNKKVNLYIKKIIEKELIPSGDYFELFDITVRLAEEKIYSARELEAYIVFENFGEGASKIDIVYSITNSRGEEVYRGVDSKVVQTEDRVVKDFDFLKLPIGEYTFILHTLYGLNVTDEFKQDFEIVEVPIFSGLSMPLIFVLIIVVLFFVVRYAGRFYRKTKKVQNKKRGGKNV